MNRSGRTVTSPDELQDWLHEIGVDTGRWGTGSAKGVVDLWNEIESGETIIQANPPLRIVNVVQVIARKKGSVLVEIEQELDDGRRRKRMRPPSEKFKSGEDYEEAALRCLQEELGVDPAGVALLEGTYRHESQTAQSPSFPGLETRYEKHIVEVDIAGLPESDFWRPNLAYAGKLDPIKRHRWGWREGSYSL